MVKVAVFASGNGSNFQAILDFEKQGKLNANISLLVCDNKGAYCIDRANSSNVETFVFNPKEYPSKQSYEESILSKLIEDQIDYIVLAGYMRLIGPTILNKFENKIINIHPSLLPAFKGLDAIGQALEYGVQVMGVTIHYVDSGMDTGTIIAQDAFRLTKEETKDQIEAQVHAIEHRLYPITLSKIFQGDNQ
jgi:phosphoribosylglycinamide formyltransferase-1